jgi:hypothetical protein
MSLAQREFGSIDSVVLWHAYPRIGLDDRNQFDFYRDMPGGLEVLREVVHGFQKFGVRVYVDYNPWDRDTRTEGESDLDALAELVQALQVDGIFLDTMDRGSEQFRAKLDSVRRGVALEGEIALPLERVHDHHMSWAQGFGDTHVPGVLRNKWFERRHMQHQVARWNRDRSGELHQAWLNGSGMLIWENIFGTWNGWNERDKTILRSMLPIQRRYSHLFAGENWTPLVPTLAKDVYGSLWEGAGLQLYTLVNRSQGEINGNLIPVRVQEPEQAWDLMQCIKAGTGNGCLAGTLPPRGIGCFVIGTRNALDHAKPGDFGAFIVAQQGIAQRANWDASPLQLKTKLLLTSLPLTVVYKPRKPSLENMVEVPAVSRTLEVQFRLRECGCYGVAEPSPADPDYLGLHKPIWFKREANLRNYWIDLTPVTNAQFAGFLKATGYRPRYMEKFLAHWKDGALPPGKEDHPVVYVDIFDARCYAQWLGKRIPSEEEWQYAAQGDDGRKYPWGNEMEPGRCNDGSSKGTTPVKAFPDGRSPSGLYDMCGNVWQWTESERSDGHTCFAILRGGSYYKRGGSEWYFDEGPQPTWFAAKMLLMWPGLDRCSA